MLKFASDKLREIREAKGWSQAEAAKRIKIARQQYCDYEVGKHEPSIAMAGRIADAFELSVTFFIVKGA